MSATDDDEAFLARFAAGTVVGGYVLERRLGRGGMASVFLATEASLGRRVALKILPSGAASDERFRQRFLRESRLAAAVDDPHIIPVYAAGDDDGVLYLAMRYVPGGDAGTLLDRAGPLPPAQAAAIISPVAAALDAAHRAGLVHRDVKPANILIDTAPDRADHVYLADFGISRTAGRDGTALTVAGNFVGTPDYIAPEQIRALELTGAADQYSLACTTFELLTGQPPFAAADQGALAAHLVDPPPPLSSRDARLAAADPVLARALTKDPAARYPACRDFADGLRAALGLAPYPVADRRAEPATGSGPVPRRFPPRADHTDPPPTAQGADPHAAEDPAAAGPPEHAPQRAGPGHTAPAGAKAAGPAAHPPTMPAARQPDDHDPSVPSRGGTAGAGPRRDGRAGPGRAGRAALLITLAAITVTAAGIWAYSGATGTPGTPGTSRTSGPHGASRHSRPPAFVLTTVSRKIKAGYLPNAIAISPDGRTAYVTNYMAGPTNYSA